MKSHEARAFWVAGPARGEIRAESVAAPAEGEVLVRALYSGVSRGTEALVFNHRVPESEYERMRAPFQAGAFPAPVKYGYASVGRVESGPEALEGRKVFCLYPHQTLYVVPVEAVTPVPENVPAGRAILAANLETAVNGIWDAAPTIGDRVAVVGAGAVGCLVAWLARRVAGTEVELIDVDARKAGIAAALDVTFRRPREASVDADIVVHASGTAEGLATALALAGFEAKVVEMSWFGAGSVAAPLGEAFHARRLTLVSSQVGSVATRQRARWDRARRMELVMRLLDAAELDALISGETPFEELPATMAALASSSGGVLCHRVVYS